jgi:hypothetical protein
LVRAAAGLVLNCDRLGLGRPLSAEQASIEIDTMADRERWQARLTVLDD